jgi:hypothetical protein
VTCSRLWPDHVRSRTATQYADPELLHETQPTVASGAASIATAPYTNARRSSITPPREVGRRDSRRSGRRGQAGSGALTVPRCAVAPVWARMSGWGWGVNRAR